MNLRNEFRMPEWAANWKTFLIFATISFAFAFALRCLDLPKWDTPSCSVAGEYIMGTHDAYYWLAGAKGVGSAVDNPMSELVRSLGAMTGAKYGNIAFWLPAVFAGFTAVAAFGWGMLVAGPWVGLATAVYATSVPAFFYRTRLSYYDTDVVTLFLPLLISLLLARWLLSATRDKWLPIKGIIPSFQPVISDYLVPFVAGVVTSYGSLWHGDVLSYGMGAFIMAVFFAVFLSRGLERVYLLRGLVLFATSAFLGLPGGVVALVLLFLFRLPIDEKYPFLARSRFYFILLALIFAVGVGDSLYTILYGKIAAYLKPVAEGAGNGAGPIYPGIAQSVIEAQNIKISALFDMLTGSNALAWIGFAGFAFLIAVRPIAVLLLPFGVVTFAAIKLGGRFSMFGGAAVGIGLSFLLYYFIEKVPDLKARKVLKPAQAVLVTVLLMFNLYPGFKSLAPTPIMTPSHAKALIEVGKKTPENSTFWTWWDWGYATMYYAGRHSFADGGHHGGKVLFPLAFSYSTPSLLQSSQMVKYSATVDNDPAKSWKDMSADQVANLLTKLGAQKISFPKVPKQYFVVSWSDIRLAYWILYYGSWDVKNGVGIHPMTSALMKPFDFDSAGGLITIYGEKPFKVSGYDLLESDKRVGDSYKGTSGPRLIYNKVVRQGYMVDDFSYSSTLMKLLIGNPESKAVKEKYRLVYEGFPMVRIYEVL